MPKKKHHYVPIFYLAGFTDPNSEPYLWVYEKGILDVRKSLPKNEACENYYHAFKTKEGRDTDTVENWLDKAETAVSPLILKLCRHEPLEEDERRFFSFFLGLMMVRVPNYRRNVDRTFAGIVKKIILMDASYKQGFEAGVKKYEEKFGESMGNSEELRQFALSGQYDIKVNPELSLKIFLENAFDLGRIFNAMTWTFVEATDDYKFVTSDNPLHYYNSNQKPNSFYGRGLLMNDAEVTFPITRDLGLLATWGRLKGGYWKSKKVVKAMSRMIIINAERFVYAPVKSDDLCSLVQKHKDSSPKIQVH